MNNHSYATAAAHRFSGSRAVHQRPHLQIQAQPDTRASRAYRFGGFVLVCALFELRSRAGVVQVAPKVFDLLLFLVENRDRVVTHADLRAKLWPNVSVTQSSLTFAVGAARRALGDTGRDQRMIQNLRRRGYRFIADVEEGRV
jgi:DNA-binding winged helix-turn-helix (wHTH) protein